MQTGQETALAEANELVAKSLDTLSPTFPAPILLNAPPISLGLLSNYPHHFGLVFKTADLEQTHRRHDYAVAQLPPHTRNTVAATFALCTDNGITTIDGVAGIVRDRFVAYRISNITVKPSWEPDPTTTYQVTNGEVTIDQTPNRSGIRNAAKIADELQIATVMQTFDPIENIACTVVPAFSLEELSSLLHGAVYRNVRGVWIAVPRLRAHIEYTESQLLQMQHVDPVEELSRLQDSLQHKLAVLGTAFASYVLLHYAKLHMLEFTKKEREVSR